MTSGRSIWETGVHKGQVIKNHEKCLEGNSRCFTDTVKLIEFKGGLYLNVLDFLVN